MPEYTTTVLVGAVAAMLAGVAARYARRNRRLERQIAALGSEKQSVEQMNKAALAALNDAILQNAHLRRSIPVIVIAGQPFVQTYEMQRGFSLN